MQTTPAGMQNDVREPHDSNALTPKPLWPPYRLRAAVDVDQVFWANTVARTIEKSSRRLEILADHSISFKY
jgi:hypothetical protein